MLQIDAQIVASQQARENIVDGKTPGLPNIWSSVTRKFSSAEKSPSCPTSDAGTPMATSSSYFRRSGRRAALVVDPELQGQQGTQRKQIERRQHDCDLVAAHRHRGPDHARVPNASGGGCSSHGYTFFQDCAASHEADTCDQPLQHA